MNGVEYDGVLFHALIKGRHNVIGKQFYGQEMLMCTTSATGISCFAGLVCLMAACQSSLVVSSVPVPTSCTP